MPTLIPTTISRLNVGMCVTFNPEEINPKHVTCCYRERVRNGRGPGYYVKLTGDDRGKMYAGNKRVWVEIESKGDT